MKEHSVRWKSDTHLVKIGKYWIPKVGITGDYLIRGGEYNKGDKDGPDDAGAKTDTGVQRSPDL